MLLRKVIRGVQDAQRLVREREQLIREVRRVLDQQRPQQDQESPAARPKPQRERSHRGHGPDCKHCQLVEAYRLERDSQVRHAESLACGDEDFRPITFKEWLVTSGQERRVADEEWAAEWATA